MTKKEADRLNREQVKRCTAHADAVKSFRQHQGAVSVVHSGQTSKARGRKKYADGYQTSAAEKIDTAITPVRVRVSTTIRKGGCTMTLNSWAKKQ